MSFDLPVPSILWNFFFGTFEQLCKDEATAACLHNMQDGPGSAHLKSRWCYSICMQQHRRDRAMGLSRHYYGGRDHCRCSDPKSRNLERFNLRATPQAWTVPWDLVGIIMGDKITAGTVSQHSQRSAAGWSRWAYQYMVRVEKLCGAVTNFTVLSFSERL